MYLRSERLGLLNVKFWREFWRVAFDLAIKTDRKIFILPLKKCYPEAVKS